MRLRNAGSIFKILIVGCTAILPVILSPIAGIIGLMTMQAIWLLECSLRFVLFIIACVMMTSVYIHKGNLAWCMEPTIMMIPYYHAMLSAGSKSGIAGVTHVLVTKLWPLLSHVFLNKAPFWWIHAPVGIVSGASLMLAHKMLAKMRIEKQPKKSNTDHSAAITKHQTSDDGTLIGTDSYGKPVTLTDKAANQHVLVLGTTGSGKTVTVCNIVESAIHRSIPVIYIDGKGDDKLAQTVATYARGHNRMACVFSMREGGVTYNPLAVGGFTSKKDRIVELREWTEEHYKKLAEGYLQCVFKIMECCNIPCNLITLASYLDLKSLKALLRKHAPENIEVLTEELSHQEQAAKTIESLLAEIRNFSASEIGCLFRIEEDKPVLTLDSILEHKGVAYFSLPALEFPSMSKTLGKLIINDLKATIAKRWNTGLNSKVYVIFDEFSVFAGEQVLNVINMGRSAGIHAILCTQSLSDIASARSNNATHFMNQVVGNCNNFILHRQNSPEDAEMLAQIIGTRNTTEYTIQLKENEPTQMGTIKHIKGFITHPDEIKRLQTGEAFFFSKEQECLTKIKARRGSIW